MTSDSGCYIRQLKLFSELRTCIGKIEGQSDYADLNVCRRDIKEFSHIIYQSFHNLSYSLYRN